MKERMQKKSQDTCRRKDRAEPEGYVGGQTYMRITENNITNVDRPQHGLLEEILSPTNLNKAYRRVKGNNGACGMDGMGADELLTYLSSHKDEILESILRGKYRPNPVRRVEIPKDNGKKRQLGIPTVVDRMIQQAITQTISPLFEHQFSDTSYGFRPKRSAHQALRKCQEFIDAGYKYAIDMDLEKFFDTVNQSKLVEILSRTIKDGRVISLIHKYLRAGVIVCNTFEETELGVPQGGPLSPLLSNIMLNELDKELERRGHRFVRYADDCIILCKSKRSAERALTNIVSFIEDKLFLKVNREKTMVAYVRDIKFLGYSFYVYRNKGRLRVHPKSFARLKESLRVLTSRSNGWGNEKRKEKLKQFITGWVNYFKMADMKRYLERLDSWLRRRIRMVIWKQWKQVKTRFRNLIKLGIPESRAYMFANTRKGYWHTANSPILATSISSDSLVRAGYTFLSDYLRSCQ
jgi:RNA-directed DNA polymerase